MRPPDEATSDGSATVWLLSLSLVLAVACAAGVCLGAAVLTRHRAAAAADAAALAGALHADGATSSACAAARTAAAADGAALHSCAVVDGVVTVTVLASPPSWLSWLRAGCGQSRAGEIPAVRGKPAHAGPRRNLAQSTSLCPATKPRE